MCTVYIELRGQRDAQAFVAALSGLSGQFDLVDESCILDARSLMGIFSLDLTKPLRLNIERDTPENLRALERFMVYNGAADEEGKNG